MGRRVLRWAPLVLVVLALVGAALAANSSGPRVGTGPRGTIPAGSWRPEQDPAKLYSQPPPPAHQGDHRPHSWMLPGWTFLLIGVLLAGGAAVAILLLLMLRMREAVIFRRRPQLAEESTAPASGSPSQADVRQALRDSLAELIGGDDPRAAVIACWLRLEDLAESTGLPRQPSDAPGDLVARMLDGRLTGPAVAALGELTQLYRSARYSPHPVPESARTAARSALDRLHAELSVRDALPAGGRS